jgi:4a-hydroxytetrahydrobiopterin dehydratase
MIMSDLSTRSCKACEGGVAKLERTQAQSLLVQIPGWTLDESATAISRSFKFKNYYETMAFVNAIAWISHREDHHSDMEVSYSKCAVRYSTHAVKGLSENDFICAAKVNALLGE